MLGRNLIFVVMLAGAGAWGQKSQARPAADNAAQESAARPAAPEGDMQKYRIGPGDVLQVDVWKEPDASIQSATVQSDGSLSLPILGEVKASGYTLLEFQKYLTERYGQFIRDARPTVMVREINSQRVYVIGEVRREGPHKLVGPMTVLQALAEAGGITDYAKRKKIYILRGPEQKTVIPFDYEAVVRGDKAGQNILLQPGDTVVVPR